MKTILILLAFIIMVPFQIQGSNKNPRTKTVKKLKLKKTKLPKEYRLYEPGKKKKKSYNPTYTNKTKRFYKQTSEKINPGYFCKPKKKYRAH